MPVKRNDEELYRTRTSSASGSSSSASRNQSSTASGRSAAASSGTSVGRASSTAAGSSVGRAATGAVGTSAGYRPLDTSGNDYAGMVGMSDLDRAALEAAKQSWDAASAAGDRAAMDAAHRQAETIRNKYGYSGGSDGSQYLPYQTVTPEFSYEAAPEYVNRYQQQIDNLTNEILNRDPFSYNYLEDPNYLQYREAYTRNGQRAMQDALGQLAARTGGLASSYAATASQQAYNNYMSELSDIIPELRQLAYSMYLDEGNADRANLEMLTALEAGDYAKYQDLLAQYNTDRNFAYGMNRDSVSDAWNNIQLGYQMGRDQISDQRYEDELAYERALNRAQLLAAAGDFSGYAALGYSNADIATLQNAYNQANAGYGGISYSGGGSGGSSGSGGGSGSGTGNLYQQLYDSGLRSEGDAYAWLIANGYNSTESGNLAGYFAQWLENGGAEDYAGGTGDSDLPIDWSSVNALGHGELTEEELADMEYLGLIESYVEDGMLKFRNDRIGGIADWLTWR